MRQNQRPSTPQHSGDKPPRKSGLKGRNRTTEGSRTSHKSDSEQRGLSLNNESGLEKKPFKPRGAAAGKPYSGDKPFRKSSRISSDNNTVPERKNDRERFDGSKKSYKPRGFDSADKTERKNTTGGKKEYSAAQGSKDTYRKPQSDWKRKDKPAGKPAKLPTTTQQADESIRLNKFLSNAGICSRREADALILAGAVMVNGKVVTELGVKILPTDKVQYGEESVHREKHVYVLLNKPKGYITTTDDPFDRNTVMSLVADACRERIYPVGRLDRNTSGLLLFTNDGELAKKLTHPSHKVRKVYSAELDKPLTKTDLLTIAEGVELEDGFAQVDEIAYVTGARSKREVGVELHSGRNRIVRRIFEAFGYEVVKLDRVVFAGLTKKDLPRGRWRLLTEQEVNFLKMIK